MNTLLSFSIYIRITNSIVFKKEYMYIMYFSKCLDARCHFDVFKYF